MEEDYQFNRILHLQFNHHHSFLEDAFNGNSLLQNFIKARLTNRQTVRLLLDQEQLEAQKNAIASEIADRTVKVLRSVFH